jgi:hypothetical protein
MELHLTLKTDATFGRGDGVAGLVDEEVEYDAATGLPYVRGRTVRGLLVEECANILFALGPRAALLTDTARELFGAAGSTLQADGILRVGAAQLPQNLRDAVEADIAAERLTPTEVLESLTAIRRQTSVDETTGAPEKGSLRSVRVLLRATELIAPLEFIRPPTDVTKAQALLAACVLALRRGGTGRNRGRGQLTAYVDSVEQTATYFKAFEQAVSPQKEVQHESADVSH